MQCDLPSQIIFKSHPVAENIKSQTGPEVSVLKNLLDYNCSALLRSGSGVEIVIITLCLFFIILRSVPTVFFKVLDLDQKRETQLSVPCGEIIALRVNLFSKWDNF